MDELTNGFDANDFALEQTMELLLTKLPTTIRYFCWKHRNQLHPDEEDDLRQQIFLYLIEDNCRRLRTYDSRKASFKTWLHRVVEHEINHYLRRRKKTLCLDEVSPDSFAYEDSQERRILYREQKSKVRELIQQLTDRERQILQLLLDDSLSSEEIARQLKIKPASLRHAKHLLLKKAHQLLGGGTTNGSLIFWRIKINIFT